MSDQPTPGEILAAKYRVENVLGRGGMGVVVSAVHEGLGQRVALKLLLEEIRKQDPTAEKRFDREARSAAQLRGPHVCRVLDAGFLEDGTPFLAMEYLEGIDLAEELATRGPIEPEQAARWVRQACEGVAEAHGAGIVHRDLKPANLFLTPRPDGGRILKVLDFGVSKSIAPEGAAELSLTKTATVVGSPMYMSPEQLRSSKDVDARTDVWSLGVILFELLTGRTPFEGESMLGLAHSILSDPLPTLDELGVSAPPGLEDALRRALTKDPDARFASAAELSAALRPFAPDPLVTGSDTPQPPGLEDAQEVARNSADPAPTPSSSQHSARGAERGGAPRWVWWTASLLVVAALALAFWLRQGGEPPEAHDAQDAADDPREQPPAAPSPADDEAPAAAAAREEAPSAAPQAPTPSEKERSAQAEVAEPAVQEAEPADADADTDKAEARADVGPRQPAPRTKRQRAARRRQRTRPAEPSPPDTDESPPAAETETADSLPDFGGRR